MAKPKQLPQPKPAPKRDLQPVLINFERGLLDRLDRMTQNMGLRRTAFITNCVAEKLLLLEQIEIK